MNDVRWWFEGDAWPPREHSQVSMFGLAADHRNALVRVRVQAIVIADGPIRDHRVSPERVDVEGRWLGESVWTALGASHVWEADCHTLGVRACVSPHPGLEAMDA